MDCLPIWVRLCVCMECVCAKMCMQIRRVQADAGTHDHADASAHSCMACVCRGCTCGAVCRGSSVGVQCKTERWPPTHTHATRLPHSRSAVLMTLSIFGLEAVGCGEGEEREGWATACTLPPSVVLSLQIAGQRPATSLAAPACFHPVYFIGFNRLAGCERERESLCTFPCCWPLPPQLL